MTEGVIGLHQNVTWKARHFGLPFNLTSRVTEFEPPHRFVDEQIRGPFTVWAATSEFGRNEAYNITNGDMFRWSSMWPRIAAFFELDVAPPLEMKLTEVMADKEPLWNAMIERHGLVDTPYSDVSSWAFGDFVFAWDYDVISDSSKSRRAGFHEYVDTEAMFLRIFEDLRAQRLIP